MRWDDLIDALDEWPLRLAETAGVVRKAAADIYTREPVGYYAHPDSGQVALWLSDGEAGLDDGLLCKAAAERVLGASKVEHDFLSHDELANETSTWVKVAGSPVLKRMGEYLNFFPGQYPGGIPNAPSPLAAILTSAILGGGLGWAGGHLLKRVMPTGYGKNLPRTGAMLGALPGAALGSVWGAGNLANDKSLVSGWPFDVPAEVEKAGEDLCDVPVSLPYRTMLDAMMKESSAFGSFALSPHPTPLDVNIDALNRVLWDGEASPELAATAMGTMYAAQQMPSSRSRPGWAMADQLGQLAVNAAGDYAKGMLAGAAINAVIGTPWRASSIGLGNAALGVIAAVLPKIFGQ